MPRPRGSTPGWAASGAHIVRSPRVRPQACRLSNTSSKSAPLSQSADLRALILVGLLFGPLSFPAFAQSTIYEHEPNNTPAEAAHVAGAVTLLGSMPAGDQDGFRWTVSDVDAQKRWTFELDGIPGQLTIVEVLRLEYADNGTDVTKQERLFTLASRDGTTPAVVDDLVFEPGEYLLGIARGGGNAPFRPPAASVSFDEQGAAAKASGPEGGYRLAIHEGARLLLDQHPRTHGAKNVAQALRAGSEYAAFAETPSAWYRLRLGKADATGRWEIDGQVPVGRSARAVLRDAAGKELARADTDRVGKLAFRDLGLPAGDTFVEIQEASGGIVEALAAFSTGVRAAGAEVEPNDTWDKANRVDIVQPLTGRMGTRGDSDVFRFAIDEEASDHVWTMALETAATASFRFCLLDRAGHPLQCRDDKGGIELDDLLLQPGEYGLSASRGPANAEYSVHVTAAAEPQAGSEAEPNDSFELASTVPANHRIKGRFTGGEDTDFYRFVVTGEPQLWRFQVIGTGIDEVALVDNAGVQNQRVRPSQGQRRVRLENVFLLPGRHSLSVRGHDGSYTLLAVPLGQPDPNGEREPNDDARRTQPLRIGQTRTGLLADTTDKDDYRFYLAAWDHIHLTVTPPADGAIDAQLYWGEQKMRAWNGASKGQPAVLDGVFPPGDYRIELSSRTPSDDEYTLHLERRERFTCPTDCEPNDNPAFASPLPPSHVLSGTIGEWGDTDWYVLPARKQATAITIKPTTERRIRLSKTLESPSLLSWDAAAGVYHGTVPAGTRTFLEVHDGPREYHIDVSLGDAPAPADPAALPVALSVETETAEVAAYRPEGQRVSGRVHVANRGKAPLTVALEPAASDLRWHVELGVSDVTVPAGGSQTVPLTVRVPSDAWADRPVRVTVAARAASGAHAEAFAELTPGRDAVLAHAAHAQTVPEALRGGLDVAWTALGARQTSPSDTSLGYGFEYLFDGLSAQTQVLGLRAGRAENQVTVALAGGQPVEVAGFAFDAFGRDVVSRVPRDVAVQLSSDGRTFETVWQGRLQPVQRDQFFALESPRPASFARLLLTTNWEGRSEGNLELGEWKVIARPGDDISDGKGFNLASPELGGHVVWANPSISGDWDSVVLTEHADHRTVRVNTGEALEWVVGFHHDRAARIARLEWMGAPAKPGQRIGSVSLAASLDSPAGPWTPIGEFDLPQAAGPAEFTFKQPVWARFVKFSTPAAETRGLRAVPDTVRLWERPTGGDYRSILGEWGYGSQEAIFEALGDLAHEAPLAQSGNDSRARAAALAPGTTVSGEVQLGHREHWYRLAAPAGQNALTITLGGEPTVRTEVHLEDSAGKSIPLRKLATESTALAHVFEAIVQPGSTVFLRVTEPPRNVAFVWDTSASVTAFLPMIYNSLGAYAEGLVPGRDAANLVPFGSDVLLRDWYGEPFIVETVLTNYPRKESSSDAERTLDKATRALAPLAGAKAVVVITDAATTRDKKVWDAFASVRPRVFSLGVAVSGAHEQDLMEDWSRVNGGYYTHLLDQGEMEVAFDRVATLLRGPAPYTLSVTTAHRKAPGPGELTLTSGPHGSGEGAIELILDASGSMLQRIGGKRRIEIAKDVLSAAVGEHIPAGTPLALRVFGDKEANSCRTDLEIPMRPLDPAAVTRTLQGVNAMNLAKTPIADSLARVASDLRQAKGRRVVVLVTDGEETCGGDPEKVLEDFEARGVDVSLNIVGFAIDDSDLQEQFRSWAELGGGQYFSARDEEGLSGALTKALKTHYTVYDSGGTLAGEGWVDGDPVELPPGTYRVVVDTAPAQHFDRVEVTGGERVTLTLK
jgi:von Willebrand factor type A domain